VESLGEEAVESLLALYVDAELNLLAADTIAQGEVGSSTLPFARIIRRGRALGATAFILVHNHPSGDPTPSLSDVMVSGRLYRDSKELDLPLLAHLIVAGDDLVDVLW